MVGQETLVIGHAEVPHFLIVRVGSELGEAPVPPPPEILHLPLVLLVIAADFGVLGKAQELLGEGVVNVNTVGIVDLDDFP